MSCFQPPVIRGYGIQNQQSRPFVLPHQVLNCGGDNGILSYHYARGVKAGVKAI